jgi:hypothetical protein
MNTRSIIFGAATALAMAGLGSVARADAIPYPCCGYNATTYTFTATSTGEIDAYFAGSTAGYDNELGLWVNGVSTGIIGLDNHTSALGQELDLGSVMAGDTLVFVLQNNSLGEDAYSNPALNLSYDDGPATGTTDGHNHVYSTPYTATSPIIDSIPVGIFVAFEDLPFPGSDYNYNDEDFVFTNTTEVVSSPEASTWVMMLAGFGGLGFAALRRSRKAAVSIA